jgi:hypothetical protein
MRAKNGEVMCEKLDWYNKQESLYYVVVKWQSDKEIRDRAPKNLQVAYDQFKKFLNDVDAAIFLHIPCGDCEVNGPHFHGVVRYGDPFGQHLARYKPWRNVVEKMKAVNIKTQSMKVKRDDRAVYKYMMKKPKYFMGASTTEMVLQCKRAGNLWEMDTVEDVNMADIDTEVDETEQDCVEQVSSEYDSMYKAMGLHAVEGETPKTGDMSKYVISDSADDLEIPSSMKRPSCSMAELGLPEQQKKKKKMTNYNRLELT